MSTPKERLAELTRTLREDYGIATPGAASGGAAEETPAAPKPRLNKDGSTWAEDFDLTFDWDRAAREQGFFEASSADGSLARATRARDARKATEEAAAKKSGARSEMQRRLEESDRRQEERSKQQSEREQKERERVSAEWKRSGGSRLP